MARAPVAASTKFFTNRLNAFSAFAVAAVGGIGYLLGSRPTTENNEGVSNTTLIVVAVAAAFAFWVMANDR